MPLLDNENISKRAKIGIGWLERKRERRERERDILWVDRRARRDEEVAEEEVEGGTTPDPCCAVLYQKRPCARKGNPRSDN